MDQSLPVAQAAGMQFIHTLGPEDLAQVVQFNERMVVLRDFTADQSQLEAAIRDTHASGPTALYNALYVTLKELRLHGTPEAPRRRAIVLLSDGEDTASLVNDEQVLDQARAAEIGVYSIALRPERPLDRERVAFSQATHFLTSLARETGASSSSPTPSRSSTRCTAALPRSCARNTRSATSPATRAATAGGVGSSSAPGTRI
jgi:Ca-activated chloride channel family protein